MSIFYLKLSLCIIKNCILIEYKLLIYFCIITFNAFFNIFRQINNQQTMLQSSYMSCHSLNELSSTKDELMESELEDGHRPLPGFRTILQCGRTMYGDSVFNKSVRL